MSTSDEIAVFGAKFAIIIGFIILSSCSLMCCLRRNPSQKQKDRTTPTFHQFNLKKYEPVPNHELNKVETLVERQTKPRALVFYIDDDIDIASFVRYVIATYKKSEDIVVFHINSNGGSADEFSSAYTNILRLQQHNIKTVALIDGSALSGGYMIACACQEIVASPSARVGSIGVILQTFNVRSLLERFGIKPVYLTTTPHKGLGGLIDDITPEREAALHTEMEYVFNHFKTIVRTARPLINPDEVFSARTWYASSAPVGMVDKVQASDDYLLELMNTHYVEIVQVSDNRSYKEKIMSKLNLQQYIKNRLNVRTWSINV